MEHTQIPQEATLLPLNVEVPVENEMPAAPLEQSITTATRLDIAQILSWDTQSTVTVSEYAPSTHIR